MPNKNKIPKEEKNRILISKWIKVLAVVLVVGVAVVFIACMPDVILAIRSICIKVFRLPIPQLPATTVDVLTIDNYIMMELTIYNGLVTAALACVAYRLSKILGNIQIKTQTAQEKLWAKNLARGMKRNLKIIYTSTVLKTSPDDLQVDRQDEQDVINLNTAGLINDDERKMLEACLEGFTTTAKYYVSDKTKAESAMSTITSNYINMVSEDFELQPHMEDLLTKLNRISREGNSND